MLGGFPSSGFACMVDGVAGQIPSAAAGCDAGSNIYITEPGSPSTSNDAANQHYATVELIGQ